MLYSSPPFRIFLLHFFSYPWSFYFPLLPPSVHLLYSSPFFFSFFCFNFPLSLVFYLPLFFVYLSLPLLLSSVLNLFMSPSSLLQSSSSIPLLSLSLSLPLLLFLIPGLFISLPSLLQSSSSFPHFPSCPLFLLCTNFMVPYSSVSLSPSHLYLL